MSPIAHEGRLFQDAQMTRDRGLRLGENLDKFRDVQLLEDQQLQQALARAIRQGAEDAIAVGGLGPDDRGAHSIHLCGY